MENSSSWSFNKLNQISLVKHWLANLSLKVRGEQLEVMKQLFDVNKKTKVLDVGVSPNEELIDTNFFEKNYPYLEKVTAASIEDCSQLKDKYMGVRFIKIKAGEKLPFADKMFDLVVSWATLEHVGGYKEQAFFLSELERVGKKVFVTTPYRGCVYEPHTGIFLLHWLPLKLFRGVCKIVNKPFWSKQENLNPLWVRDVKKITDGRLKIRIYKTFGILPTHLLIHSLNA